MAVLTLDEIKAHLYMDADDASKDAHLTLLNEAAEDYATQYLGRSMPWLDALGVPVVVPGSIKAALLLILADLYENREAVVVGSIVASSPTAERLLHFYRVGLGV